MSKWDRPELKTSEWRSLSAELSEQIRASFNVDELDLPTPELEGLFTLPAGFRIHKTAGLQAFAWVSGGLLLYGEWDRAAPAFDLLERVPINDHLVPDEDSLVLYTGAAAYLAHVAGRTHDADRFAELTRRPAGHVPARHLLEGTTYRRYLDMTDEDRARYIRDPRPLNVARRYIATIQKLSRIWVHGASDTFTREDCEREIDRYAKAIFALPGFAPWNDRAYPYDGS